LSSQLIGAFLPCCFGEKLEHDAIELVRLLDTRKMSRSRNDDLAGTGDLGHEPVGDDLEVGDVLSADDHECRLPDFVEALGRRRICEPGNRAGRWIALVRGEDRLERTALFLPDMVPGARIEVGSEPDAQIQLDCLVDPACVEKRVLLLVVRIELRGLVPSERAVHEDERAQPLGMKERGVERGLPAERVPDKGRRLDLQVVEKRAQVVDVGEGAARERRLPVAARVVANDPVVLGEAVPLSVPEAAPAECGVQ
jgi:hypothetical protein